MDLKHIESLAKDKDLMYADIVSCFMNFDKKYDLERFDYSDTADVKNYDELTDEQKKDLIGRAHYYWLKDDGNISLGCICDCVMAHQIEMFNASLSNHEFFAILYDNFN